MTREEAITYLKVIWNRYTAEYEIERETLDAYNMAIETLSAEAKPTMTGDVREALMRLTMCAREECGMCKYKDECGFEFQYNISTENMHTILDALQTEPVKHGEWQGYNADKGDDWLRNDGTPIFLVCDKCYETVINNGSAHWNYCPNCGAKMNVHIFRKFIC